MKVDNQCVWSKFRDTINEPQNHLKDGTNGQLIMPEGFYDQKTYTVGGENGVDVEKRNAIDPNAGGKVKGMIMKDNELRSVTIIVYL